MRGVGEALWVLLKTKQIAAECRSMAWPSGAISALPYQLFLFSLLHPLSSSQQAGTGENLVWEEGVKDADADEG